MVKEIKFNDIKINTDFLGSKKAEEKDIQNDIAIVGVSVNLPSGEEIGDFWKSIMFAEDQVKELPEVRKMDLLNYLRHVRETENIEFQQCAYIKEIDKFDNKFFNISPTEAKLMSPLHRLHMEVIWKALEDYGYSDEQLNGEKIGIFSGLINDDDIYYYRDLVRLNNIKDLRTALTGNLYAMISARISYFLNLKGPAVMNDTACSSSMTSLVTAMESIKSGQCKAAVVTGAYLKFMAVKDENELIGIESLDGRTRAFDNEAEGSGFGEGVVAIVIKSLKQAEKDNDKIYGVIKGYATNQDGRSLGITAPNLDSQCDVIRRSIESSKVKAEDITYFETHGTATNIGDVIESSSIEKVLKGYSNKRAYCAAGSVKSNIGHLFAASGVTSVVKCILAIKNGIIPPSINFNYPNKKINFIDSPIYINTIPRKWEPDNKRICSISNFGISGTNCNIILEEYEHKKTGEINLKDKYIFTITAKSKKSLEDLISKYINFLQEEDVELRDFSYSTLVRRNHFKHRVIFIVSSVDDAIEKLKYALNTYETADGKNNVYYGFVDKNKNINTDEIDKLLQLDDISSLKELCNYYIQGFSINWNKLFDKSYSYINIPSYCYDRKRYWIELKENCCYKPIINNIKEEVNNQQEIEETREIIVKSSTGREITKTEGEIGKIWAEVLGFTEIEVEDNYFELGGDSILGIKIINLLNSYFNIDFSVTKLLEEATVEKLAVYVEDVKEHKEEKIEVIKSIEEMEYYDLSSSQMRIFLLEQIESNITKYNINAAYIVNGSLDIEKLEKVINKIIERHEVLRSKFVICDGVPKQKVLPKIEFKVEREEQVDDIDSLIQKFVRKFDLEKPPLLRCLVGKLQDGKELFLFDMHHIVTDGTSFDILIHEIETLYNGKELEPLKIQYKDYAAYYNEMPKSKKWKKEEEYWLENFKEKAPVLNMQSTYPREDKVYKKGEKFYFEFSDDLTRELKEFVSKNKVTNFMVTISALYILLYKHSQDKKICIGTPTSGRFNRELNDLIGVFINTLVIKNEINEDKSFIDFLSDVKNNVLEAFDNADYGFEHLVEKIRVNKEISRNPLFDVMFIYQNLGDKSINLEETEFFEYDIKNAVPKYDLTLELRPKGNKIYGNFEYPSELFSHEYISNLSQHYINILNQIVKKKDIKIKDINILSENEKNTVIEFGKGKERNINKTVIDMFKETSNNYPENTAVYFENKSITYKELDEISDKIACYLDEKCKTQEMYFPVVMNRSIELMAVLLGILKCGGSYIPLDPEYPKERIDYILENSESKFIITSKEIEYENNNVKKIYIEDILVENIEVKEMNKASLGDKSYVIYTSGSTGKPKGVMIRHREMSNFVQAISEIEKFEIDTKILSVTTISFDIFVLESFVPLCNGSSMILASEKEINDVDAIADLIIKHKVDMAQFTPSRAQMLLVMENSANSLKNLKTLFIGGEAFPEDLLRQLKNYTNSRIINMYGPTETTVWSSYKDLTNEESISIGKPILNTNLYILNDNDELQFLGGCGEIAIGGLGVSEGYVNNEEMTNSRFIRSKFNDDFIYKTGDLGKWLKDGSLYHMGRIDNQVKVRGYRVELGEIEEVILKGEKVLQCAVITKNINNTVSIAAFIVVSDDFNMDELKDYIASELPAYMIPSSINIIDKIPMTDNGKLNRKELLSYEVSEDNETYMREAVSETEKVIYGIWSEILEHENFGVNSKFFEIGGNSLLLIKMLKLIKDKYDTKLMSSDLFTLQTIYNIADFIDKEKDTFKVSYESIILPQVFFSSKKNGHTEIQKISIKTEEVNKLAEKFGDKYSDYEITAGIFMKLLSSVIKKEELGLNITRNEGRYIPLKVNLKDINTLDDLFSITSKAINENEVLEENCIYNTNRKNEIKILLCMGVAINFDIGSKNFSFILRLKRLKDCFNIEFAYDSKVINGNAVDFLKINYEKMLGNMGGNNGKL